MRRFITTLLLALILVGGGWALVNRDQIHNPQDVFRLVTEQMNKFRSTAIPSSLASWTQSSNEDSLRIATFNIQTFGTAKASNPQVMQYLAEICRQFDVIAIQEIRGQDQTLLPQFVKQINDGKLAYEFVISPPLGRKQYREQSAFIFNQAKVQLDNAYTYTVNDPEDVMIREPFVGWFRAANVRPDEAFTFSLVNLHLDAQRPTAELPYLTELFRAVRADGRGEDDVLLVGDFNAGDRGLASTGRRSGLTWVISNQATNTRANNQYDNIVFDGRATVEYTGRSGVFDFLKHFNLSLNEALEISDHLPVWADFYCGEGQSPQRTAEKESSAKRLR